MYTAVVYKSPSGSPRKTYVNSCVHLGSRREYVRYIPFFSVRVHDINAPRVARPGLLTCTKFSTVIMRPHNFQDSMILRPDSEN
jgi:hypothetical protein